jgi:hypothetical protein
MSVVRLWWDSCDLRGPRSHLPKLQGSLSPRQLPRPRAQVCAHLLRPLGGRNCRSSARSSGPTEVAPNVLDGYALTAHGREGLGRLGVNVAALDTSRRRLAYPCTDWTERRYHLAGGLGAQITKTFLDRDRLRYGTVNRQLMVTPVGRRHIQELLDVGSSDSTERLPTLATVVGSTAADLQR